jgi:D-xylose transport system substrate-binding protein
VVSLRSVSKAVASKAMASVAIASSAALLIAACGGSSSSSGSLSTLSSSQVPKLSYTAFKLDFSAMATIKILASHGSGKVAAILPDTVSSIRYEYFDLPYLAKAMTDAGLPNSEQIIQNAQGSDATEYTDALADIARGAKVLILDPLDPDTGAKIEAYAKSHGVQVIDYDRMTLGGSRKYYVGFSNVAAGTLLGHGLESCITAWKVKSPKVIVMRGDSTDNNATLLAKGYDAVLAPKFSSKAYTDVADPAGTWTPATARSEFRAAFTKNPNASALLSPNDENAASIIQFLRTKEGIKPKTFPVTGQDATVAGLQNIIAGYQCGTVYKPIYLEAQAAVALAMYLRAGITPPKSLVNGSVSDVDERAPVRSILLKPEWVTPQRVMSTVVRDKFVPASQICFSLTKDCAKYGISY